MRERATHFARLGVLLLVAACAVACGRTEAEDAAAPQDNNSSLHIVTLAPALTQMLVDLGRADALVGVTDKDTAAPPGLPVVGNYVDLDTEKLIAARPTHVMQMVSKEGVPAGLLQLASAAGFEVVAYPYPTSIRDVADTLHGGLPLADGTRHPDIGELIGDRERAEALRQRFLGFFDALSALTTSAAKPRTLLVIGVNPLMASVNTVHDELLTAAGGVNAAAGSTVTAPTFDREGLLAMNPQVVLVLSPGRRLADAQAMESLLPEVQALPIDAVKKGRVVLINDPATLLPSTSLPRIAAQMAKAVHPGLETGIDRLLAAYETPPPQEPTRGDADAQP